MMAAGMMIATQSTLNAALGRSLGLSLFVFVFSAIQLATTVPLLLWSWPPKFPAGVPLWQYLGATLGGLILAGIAFGLPKTGALGGLAAVLVGQLLMGLLIDQFGLFDMPARPVQLARFAGLACVGLGVYLINR